MGHYGDKLLPVLHPMHQSKRTCYDLLTYDLAFNDAALKNITGERSIQHMLIVPMIPIPNGFCPEDYEVFMT